MRPFAEARKEEDFWIEVVLIQLYVVYGIRGSHLHAQQTKQNKFNHRLSLSFSPDLTVHAQLLFQSEFLYKTGYFAQQESRTN